MNRSTTRLTTNHADVLAPLVLVVASNAQTRRDGARDLAKFGVSALPTNAELAAGAVLLLKPAVILWFVEPGNFCALNALMAASRGTPIALVNADASVKRYARNVSGSVLWVPTGDAGQRAARVAALAYELSGGPRASSTLACETRESLPSPPSSPSGGSRPREGIAGPGRPQEFEPESSTEPSLPWWEAETTMTRTPPPTCCRSAASLSAVAR